MLDERRPTTDDVPPGSPRTGLDPAPTPDHPALGRPGPRLSRRNRERAVDRAWRGGRLATFVGATGRTLITAGLLILLFVAYQLWGTGIYTAQAQDDLKSDLKALLAPTETATSATAASASAPAPTDVSGPGDGAAVTTPTTVPATASTVPPLPSPELGDATAIVEIPRINVDWAVVEGVRRDDLKKGPGHYPTTPWPGQLGNAAIAGHRTTYGAPFNRLDELDVGDDIRVTDVSGTFTYKVTRQLIVSPSDIDVLAPPDDPGVAMLTLTTCHPKYSANQRLIIQAALVGRPLPATDDVPTGVPPAAEPGPDNPVDNPVLGTPTSAAAAVPTTTVPAGAGAEHEAADVAAQNAAIQGDIAHFHAPKSGFYLWALAAAAIGGVWWYAFRRWTRWYVWLAGVPPFLLVLFFFYVRLEAVLPAGY